MIPTVGGRQGAKEGAKAGRVGFRIGHAGVAWRG